MAATERGSRPLRVLSSTPPQPGQHLYLAVDHRLQEAAIRAFEGQSGAAIAVDPRNGEVLAMVSLPAFDANLFVSGISRANYAALLESPDRPLFNRAVQGGYEPGSTLKPLMVLMGLELGLRRPGERGGEEEREREAYGHGVSRSRGAASYARWGVP